VTGTGRPLDAIISPTAPYPSFRHDDALENLYTVRQLPRPLLTSLGRADSCRSRAQAVCNLCDYPSAAFPVTVVDPAVDVKAEPHAFASPFDKLNYERYDAETYRGAPIGLQVYARKGEDEATIRFVEICAAALEAAR